MKNNLVFVSMASSCISPRISIDASIRKRIDKFLARNEREFHENPSKCVLPVYDVEQSQPIIKTSDRYGYDTLFEAIVSLLSGWHFVKHYFRPLYRANSEGLRRIAECGCPHKAFASLRR